MDSTKRLELFEKALEGCRDYMIEQIEENWEYLTEEGYGAEKGMPDAECFLGHSVDGMSQEEIDDEVSEMQLSYYTEGEADLDNIVEQFIHINE